MKELVRHGSKGNNKREEVKREGVTLKQRDRANENTKHMERRKRSNYLYKFVTFKYNFYTLSLSFTLMAKLTRRRSKHKSNYNPKNKITTTS